jgi:hypothetical protein
MSGVWAVAQLQHSAGQVVIILGDLRTRHAMVLFCHVREY